MRAPRSLQARLGLWLGALLTLLWVAAASVTALILRHEMDVVFDSALQETAERLLPLAVVDIVGREEDGEDGGPQRLAAIREHGEFFTYVVRDDEGRILLQSHAANPDTFPAYDGPGFRQTATHRLYSDEALRGTIRITVAEPLAHRAAVAREIQIGLGLPLLVVIPAALVAIVVGGAAHDGAAGGVVFVIAAAIALLVAAQRRRAIIASCGPGCATVGPAVAYLGWAGTVKTFQFAARDYAVAFAQQNARNLINVSLELRRLLESANAPAAPLPQVTRERSAPAAQLVADPVLDWIARIESYKGAVARRNALGRALSELADPAARHQVLVAASKIEVAAVLDKVDRLSTAAAKRRHLERAIAELAADRIPAELQAAELLLLEARLRALGDRA